MGGARVTTLVTLRKCTLGHKRVIKTLKFVSASTKGFKGGLAWIKPSKKDMAVTFSYLQPIHYKQTVKARSLWLGWHVQGVGCARVRLHNPRIWEFWGKVLHGYGTRF